MNTEIKALNRFEEAGFSSGQSKATVAGIDDLLVKSTAAFREYFEHRFDAMDHRISAPESSLRSLQNFQTISLLSIVAAMLVGFAGLIFAILSQS